MNEWEDEWRDHINITDYKKLKDLVSLQVITSATFFCKIDGNNAVKAYFRKQEKDYQKILNNWTEFSERLEPNNKYFLRIINQKISGWGIRLFKNTTIGFISIIGAFFVMIVYMMALALFISENFFGYYFANLIIMLCSFFIYFILFIYYLPAKDFISYNLKSVRLTILFITLQNLLILVAFINLYSLQFFINGSTYVEMNNLFERGAILILLSLFWMLIAIFIKVTDIPPEILLFLILLRIEALKNISKHYDILPKDKGNLYLIQEYKGTIKWLLINLSKMIRRIYRLEISNKKEVSRLYYKKLIINRDKVFLQMGDLLNEKIEENFEKVFFNSIGNNRKDNKENKDEFKSDFAVIIDTLLSLKILENVELGEFSLFSSILNNSGLLVSLIGLIISTLGIIIPKA